MVCKRKEQVREASTDGEVLAEDPDGRLGETEDGTTTITLERDGATLIVKGVPARVCQNCGEAYVSEAEATRLYEMVGEAVRTGAEIEVVRYRAA